MKISRRRYISQAGLISVLFLRQGRRANITVSLTLNYYLSINIGQL